WDKLKKTVGYLVKKDPSARIVTVFAESDKAEHKLTLTVHSEFHVEGAWGSLADFSPHQHVYLIATTNKDGTLGAVHALADDISMQAMSHPLVLKKYDKAKGLLVFKEEEGKKVGLTLAVDGRTKFSTRSQKELTVGDRFYCNRSHSDSGW